MDIVILHSHLNPGGVTRIIESQIESLPEVPVKVLVGGNSQSEKIKTKGTELVISDLFGYLENRKYTDNEAMVLLHRIHAKIRRNLTPHSILHVHNLNLGKNPIVTYAVYLLAKEGLRVFNHAHDFAEDRPANFQFLKEIISDNFGQKLENILYPNLPNYHFGVLNSFDYDRLISYGVKKEKIEWLPNPVTFSTKEDINDKATAKNEVCKDLNIDAKKLLVTYPVRVIQRKNIGEFILLSVLFSEIANFVVTQPPQNPVEVERYEKWISFSKNENINITFGAGTKVNFEKLLIGSDFCITTSYKEGFGMVYLEPWLLKTPVVGRNISFITKDFTADGFQFPVLYSAIYIPGIQGDFKDLDVKTQMQIIADVKKDAIKREKIFEQNPVLNALFQKVNPSVTGNNISIIKNNYSLKGYGIKLQNRYKKMA